MEKKNTVTEEQAYEQWDIAGQPMGSFQTFLFAEYEKTLAEVKRLQKELRKQTNIVGMISDLVYDGGSHNLTWDELNEILEKW